MSPLNENLKGREYWRSLEHLAETPEVQDRIAREFSGYDPDAAMNVSRRSFMKIMGASMALAGLTLSGCRRWPRRQIRPFASRPEGYVPGEPIHYATMMPVAGAATGLLVTAYDGRPIKIENNSLHPYPGGSSVFAQASVLELYDPDRSRRHLRRSRRNAAMQPQRPEAFERALREALEEHEADQGAGLAFLAEADDSPSVERLREKVFERFGDAAWYTWEPVGRENEIEGTERAFGEPLRPIYRLDEADCIVCFEADPLGLHATAPRNASEWARGRRAADEGRMNRLWSVEARFTLTGSTADHRLPVKPSRIPVLIEHLAAVLGVEEAQQQELDERETPFMEQLAADLGDESRRGRCLVMAGSEQDSDIHAMAWAINDHLDNPGHTVRFTHEPQAGDEQKRHNGAKGLKALTERMDAGEIKTLVMLGGNPAFDAPADLEFESKLAQVERSIHLSLDINETSLASTWHVPRAHALECWHDGRAWDGTLCVQQPLIEPLYGGRSVLQVLAMCAGITPDGYAIVRQTVSEMLDGPFERRWRRLLHRGSEPGSGRDFVEVSTPGWPGQGQEGTGRRSTEDEIEVVLTADYSMLDGRHANNGWLQELPDPLTKMVWDNALMIGQADAERMGLSNGQMVRLHGGHLGEDGFEVAVWIMAGLASGTAVLPLGYGRRASGNVGTEVGFDSYRLRTVDAMTHVTGLTLEPLDERYTLASTQDHHLLDDVGQWGMETRTGKPGGSGYIIREGTFEQYRDDPKLFHRNEKGDLSLQLFPPISDRIRHPHAWGMAIDMNSCTGCSACVIACQAENNVPIVGKDEVANSREMHWLRIDRYFKNTVDLASPDVVYQPMTCLHCENAPCEQVCPVAATVHDTEGLNVMIYNRCIGTRYCSNNCPYKVRRFNYHEYVAVDPRGRARPWIGMPDTQSREEIDQIKQMVYNPEVTVRMRGVMEKCTFCIQRIATAKSRAGVEHARGKRADEILEDGEVVTACQGACPTQAIVFGDLNDPDSRVSQLIRSDRSYQVLAELNTNTRARHLGKVRNTAYDKYTASRGGEG